MPIYEYECKYCGEQFERIVDHKIYSDEFPCPKCSCCCDKIISNCNFSLKGRGWAADNYHKK